MATSDFLSIVKERGFVHQCTDETALAAKMREGPLPAYIGFDCTASSLHVGSLLPIMLLRRYQKCGHKPIVLMGGGTTKVGDPSGKDESRQILSNKKIAENKKSIGQIFKKFLTFGEGASDAVMVDNAKWLDKLHYIPLLREIGQHFSVNEMLTRDSVKLRLDRNQNLSFLEFNYMILQAYDFLELSRRHGCFLQMGGSDQWGNIVGGVDLIRRVDGAKAFGLTTPLITTASGAKMGKTADGAVWLNPGKYKASDYWQFWRNTADSDVGRFLRWFTELPLNEIARLEKLSGAEINDAKKILADEATKIIHGREPAKKAAEVAQEIFEQGSQVKNLRTAKITKQELESGVKASDLFVRTGLVGSNSEARKLIRGGGARLNDIKIDDEYRTITGADIDENSGGIKLSAGRKKHVLLKPVGGGSRPQAKKPFKTDEQFITAQAGIDGCQVGWVAVIEGKCGIEAEIFSTLKGVFHVLGPDAKVVADVPIGLLKRGEEGGRECDREARNLLKPDRSSSVFPPPVRAALRHLNNYEKANEANIRNSNAQNGGLSLPAFNIMPKIKDADDIMTPQKQKRVFEGHPELSFREMAGGKPMRHKKKSPEGRRERLALLKKHGLGAIEGWLDHFPRSQAAPDDILDAAALLWTAQRIAADNAVRIPEQPVYDQKGLDMAMWR